MAAVDSTLLYRLTTISLNGNKSAIFRNEEPTEPVWKSDINHQIFKTYKIYRRRRTLNFMSRHLKIFMKEIFLFNVISVRLDSPKF